MFVVHSYPLAVVFCVVTMLGWGSWANAKKLARPGWRFELFYWDYTLGVLLLTLILGLTLGSSGTEGRPFLADLAQASSASLLSALVGGAIFNLANILLVAAIEIAGMAVAYPVGIGLALIIGVIVNYRAAPVGNVALLASGVGLVILAIVLDAVAYRRLPAAAPGSGSKGSAKGLLISVACWRTEWAALVFRENYRIYYILNRIFWATLALFVVGAWLFFRNYPVAVAPNVVRHTHVAVVYFVVSALGLLVFTLNGLKVVAQANLVIVMATAGCFCAWAVLLTKEGQIAPPVQRVSLADRERIEKINQDLLVFMGDFRKPDR